MKTTSFVCYLDNFKSTKYFQKLFESSVDLHNPK